MRLSSLYSCSYTKLEVEPILGTFVTKESKSKKYIFYLQMFSIFQDTLVFRVTATSRHSDKDRRCTFPL